MVYRLPHEDDRYLVAWLPRVHADATALLAQGFVTLGDVVMQPDGYVPQGILRALVDETHTVCAYLVIPLSPFKSSSAVVLLLESYTQTAEFTTYRRDPAPGLAHAPFSHRQWVPAGLPHAETIARHRAFLSAESTNGDLVLIHDMDELLRELHRNEALIRSWREAQQPDALLEADLRALLGTKYDRVGPQWARRLTVPLPKATMKPKS